MTSGTKPMEIKLKRALSSQEICHIIELCAKVGVRELRFHGLYVVFGTQFKNSDLTRPAAAHQSQSDTEISESQHEKQSQAALEADEISLREDRLAQMFIENPLQAEKLLMNGELELDDEESHESETYG